MRGILGALLLSLGFWSIVAAFVLEDLPAIAAAGAGVILAGAGVVILFLTRKGERREHDRAVDTERRG